MDTTDRSFEPMDIDLSNNSLDSSKQKQDLDEINNKVSETSIPKDTFYSKNTFPITEAKRFHINLQPKLRKNRKLNILMCFLIVCIAIFVCFFIKFQCVSELKAQNVHEVLTNNLYGQEIAIQNIIKALDSNEHQKVIVLYGGTGVGKTYAINLMLSDLWNRSNVYHYTMPSLKVIYEHSLMTGLILCPFSIVVVDGLSIQDYNIKTYLTDIINKSIKLDKNVNIFLIYNCMFNNFENMCNKFIEEVQHSLSDINATKFYIKFNTLSQQELKKCIKKELNILKTDPNVNNIENLLNNFNVTLDGCKNVYSKIKTLT